MSSYFFTGSDPVHTAVMSLARTNSSIIEACAEPLYVHGVDRNAARKVALVSGGGSGHEPMHAGFVGRGMLDAAVPGQIFASPHNRQVFEACRSVAREGGVLHIIKNYTGDKINFGIAAERLRAEGIRVEHVIVDDDIATESATAATGRRGTGATVLVEKILGAAADLGHDLEELKQLGERVAAASRSLAVASRAQTSPATGEPGFALEHDQLEYGVGIHGERAKQSIDRIPAADLVSRMTEEVLAHLPTPTGGVSVFVNGLGGATNLELHNIHTTVVETLAARGIRAEISLVGSYVVALDMRGFSITLTALEPGWDEYLLAPSVTSSFPQLTRNPSTPVQQPRAAAEHTLAAEDEIPLITRLTSLTERAHASFTAFDQASGDGDFGDNLVNGVKRANGYRHPRAIDRISAAFLNDVGGSSGPLLGLLFQHVGTAFERGITSEALISGLASGLTAIRRIGGAEPGDRTLVDALTPAAEAGDARTAVRSALAGARATADLTARRGRASYVGERAVGSPDPGACGVALIIAALAEEVEPALATEHETLFAEWLG